MLRALGYSQRVRTVSNAVAHAFLLSLATGMRAGELTKLTWDKTYTDYVRPPITQTVPREVPLSPVAQRIIAQMRGWDEVLVFGLKPQTLDALFRKARAGGFHVSRHTAATRMARIVNVLTLCKIFGWKKTDQALTYFNAKASDIAKQLIPVVPTPRSPTKASAH